MKTRHALPVLLGLLAVPTAWAATLTVTPGPIGSGSATNTACDTDGVRLDYVMDGSTSNIASVTVSGIAAACNGGEVRITLKKNATGTPAQGAGTQAIDATSETVVLDAKPAITDSAFIGVMLVGP